MVIDRTNIYKRIIKKISLKTPRHVLEDPYNKMEEILVKLGQIQECFDEPNYVEINGYKKLEIDFEKMVLKLRNLNKFYIELIISVVEEMHINYD